MGSFGPIHVVLLVIVAVLFLLARAGLRFGGRIVSKGSHDNAPHSSNLRSVQGTGIRIEGLDDSGNWQEIATRSHCSGELLDNYLRTHNYRAIRAIDGNGGIVNQREGRDRLPNTRRTQAAVHRPLDDWS